MPAKNKSSSCRTVSLSASRVAELEKLGRKPMHHLTAMPVSPVIGGHGVFAAVIMQKAGECPFASAFSENKEEAQARADLIACACNSHTELRGLLQSAVNQFEQLEKMFRDDSGFMQCLHDCRTELNRS